MKRKTLQRRLSEYMQANGLKNTRQRNAILDVFLAADAHLSLEQLLKLVQVEHPGVGYATIYRTMKLFTEAGIADERRFTDGHTQYEPVGYLDEHHDHLICEICGHIFEFEDEIIEQRQRDVAARFGIQLTRHRLDLWGKCIDPAQCVKRMNT